MSNIEFFIGIAFAWIFGLAFFHTTAIRWIRFDIRSLKDETRTRETELKKEIVDLHGRIRYLETKIKDK